MFSMIVAETASIVKKMQFFLNYFLTCTTTSIYDFSVLNFFQIRHIFHTKVKANGEGAFPL